MKEKTLIYKFKNKELISARYSVFNRKCFKKHMHESFSIGLILDGNAQVIIENMNYEVTKDSIVIINPRQWHSCNPASDHPWSYYMFYIDETWFKTKITEITGINKSEILIKSNILLKNNLVNKLKDLYKSIESRNTIMDIEEKTYSIINYIFNLNEKIEVRENKNEINSAINYMEENVENSVSLHDVVELLNMSPFHFIRLFKTETGITPHKYFMNLKINKSRKYLEGGLSPLDGAYKLGFYDQSHFIKLFIAVHLK